MSPAPLNRRRVTGTVAVAIAVLLGLGMAACGADAPSRSELVQLFETSGIPAAQSRCAADAILDTLSTKQVESIVQRGSSGAPLDDPDRTDDAADKVRDALATCRAETPATVTPTSILPVEPSSTVTTRPESMQASTTSTTIP